MENVLHTAPRLNLAGVPKHARTIIRKAPATWHRWLAFLNAADDPDFELVAEEAAPMFELVAKLTRLGVPFDESFLQRVAELREEMKWTDADSDGDVSVDDGKEEPPDERFGPCDNDDPACREDLQPTIRRDFDGTTSQHKPLLSEWAGVPR